MGLTYSLFRAMRDQNLESVAVVETASVVAAAVGKTARAWLAHIVATIREGNLCVVWERRISLASMLPTMAILAGDGSLAVETVVVVTAVVETARNAEREATMAVRLSAVAAAVVAAIAVGKTA